MKKPEDRSCSIGISLPSGLLVKARASALAQRRSLSAYIAECVQIVEEFKSMPEKVRAGLNVWPNCAEAINPVQVGERLEAGASVPSASVPAEGGAQ